MLRWDVDSLDTECQGAVLVLGCRSNLCDFLENFNTYCTLYQRLNNTDETAVHSEAFFRGTPSGQKIKSWTKPELEDLLQSKHLHHFFGKIDGTPNLEKRLVRALGIHQENGRIETLCDIPGIGPVLASVLLESMYPETYGALNYHTWNALRLLKFDLAKKRACCGDSFTVRELLKYLQIIRMLARQTGTTPAQMATALYAYDRALTDDKWKRQLILILRRFTTPVPSAHTKSRSPGVVPAPNPRTLLFTA